MTRWKGTVQVDDRRGEPNSHHTAPCRIHTSRLRWGYARHSCDERPSRSVVSTCPVRSFKFDVIGLEIVQHPDDIFSLKLSSVWELCGTGR